MLSPEAQIPAPGPPATLTSTFSTAGEHMRINLRAALIIVARVLLAGCSAPAHQNVFPEETGYTLSGPEHVDEIIDAGLPGLYNTAATRSG